MASGPYGFFCLHMVTAVIEIKESEFFSLVVDAIFVYPFAVGERKG